MMNPYARILCLNFILQAIDIHVLRRKNILFWQKWGKIFFLKNYLENFRARNWNTNIKRAKTEVMDHDQTFCEKQNYCNTAGRTVFEISTEMFIDKNCTYCLMSFLLEAYLETMRYQLDSTVEKCIVQEQLILFNYYPSFIFRLEFLE